MSVWKFADRFSPALSEEHQITLGEGDTPLVRSRAIGLRVGCENLYFKLESANPTGSYKDRFAAVGISHLLANETHTCLATSSGNTGAALAAYCAAAKIRCRIAVVETAPLAKLQQMMAYGAEIERIRQFGVDANVTQQVLEKLREQAKQPGHSLEVSAFQWSPLGMQGVESIAFELAEQLSNGIDHVFSPAGGGGLTLATARGFQKNTHPTSVHCVQPIGNDTIAGPLREGRIQAEDVECTTKISGLQVASVIDGHEVIAACRKSGGTGYRVSDEQVFSAQKQLAREEGIFSEPAGAVALAGALDGLAKEEIDPNSTVVCLITGTGFKDATSVEAINRDAACPLLELEYLFRD